MLLRSVIVVAIAIDASVGLRAETLTIDTSTVYDLSCGVDVTTCTRQLIVVDGDDGSTTTLTYVDAIMDFDTGQLSPDAVSLPVRDGLTWTPGIGVTGRSRLDFQGGSVFMRDVFPAVAAVDNGVITITGGRVGGNRNGIEAYDSSRVSISGGLVSSGNDFDSVPIGALVLDDNAVGEILGGDVNGSGLSVSALGDSRLTIHGGSFRGSGLFSDDTSVMDVFGGSYSNFICNGSCGFFVASGDSRINVHGGDYRVDRQFENLEFVTFDNGEIHVFGTDLMLTELEGTDFELTGTLSDGLPVDFRVRGNHYPAQRARAIVGHSSNRGATCIWKA